MAPKIGFRESWPGAILLPNILLAFVCLGTCQSPGATLHVSPVGHDENSGEAQAPLRTISRAADLAMPGDTVLVREGVYRERVAPPRGGKPGKPITFRAAPGERVVIKGSEHWTPTWQQDSPGVYFAVPASDLFNDRPDEYVDSHNPLEVHLASTPWQRNGRREKERGFGGDERIVYTCGQLFVNGQRWRQAPLREELQRRMWHYDDNNGRVYVHFGALAPADQTVELTTRRRIFAPVERGLGYITVEGFIMEHCGNQYPTNFWVNDAFAQKGAVGTEAGHHWIIRRNLIRYAKTFAIDAGYVDKRTKNIEPYDTLIEENYIVDNGSAGILANKSRNLVIRGNVILRNNGLRFFELKRWEQAGVKCHNFRDGVIERNFIADNSLTYGIWLDNQFPDSRVSRNVLVNNDRAGLFLEMSDYDFDRLLVDNNVIVGNRENPVYIHDASGATFVHNLLADAPEAARYGQAVYIRQVSPRTKTYHHSFYNNLMLGTASVMDVNYPSHRGGPQRFDGNAYGCAETDRLFRINNRAEKPTPWSDDEFFDLIREDLDDAHNLEQIAGDGFAKLTFDQWRQFWRRHSAAWDAHSRLYPTASAAFDRATQTVAVTMPEDIESWSTKSLESPTADFFGKQRSLDAAAPPGPFAELRPGENRFEVWDGLPLLAAGELPRKSWTSALESANIERLSLDSPDGRTRIAFWIDDTGSPAYQVFWGDRPATAPASLGLQLDGNVDLLRHAEIVDVQSRTHDSTWRPVCGERSKVRDHFRELTIRLTPAEATVGPVEIVFRCYDSGVAFRYRIVGDESARITIAKEKTEFAFRGDHTSWSTMSGQGEHVEQPLSAIDGEVERPLTIRVSENLYVAVAEAAMDLYARMRLRRAASKPLTLVSTLSSPVVRSLPLETPWRVLMLAGSPAAILQQNDLIRNLNAPCQLADASWIKPGKVLREITLTTAGGLACVDFAAKHNLQFVEFDAGWYGHEYDETSDATTVSVDPKRSAGPLDLPRVISYAKSRGVEVILYVNRRALEKQLDELLPLYKSWGVAGVKFGFVRVGSQAATQWLHDAVRKAAEHQLMVDVHDEYRSTGYERTYPNLMTVEGIGGDETAPSNQAAIVNLFTRMLSGPADHKICYFDARVRRNSSHACQLAKAVCFFDPWQFLYWYDTPLGPEQLDRRRNVIHETPELEFWDAMPTVWDDTRVISGSIGDFAVIARRSGDAWFVGAINGPVERAVELPLSFLEPQVEYRAHAYVDDASVATPTQVRVQRQDVRRGMVLAVAMKANGGQALRIVPKPLTSP